MNLTHIFKTLTFLSLCSLFQTSYATHNRAGEITYRQIDELTVEATITTYTKTSSQEADQDSLTICWGDGICENVVRNNGPGSPPKGEPLENDTKVNYYIARHLYPGLGHFIISMQDPNRNAGVVNIGSSVDVPFFLQTSVSIFSSQFQGLNSSPVLLQSPIDFGCTGQRFVHSPNAYEPDGDSISYKLIVPLSDVNTEVPNYRFPDEIRPGPNNNFYFNNETGELIWESPQAAGEYNIALLITEHRDGVAIDSMIRDMQIFIENCENQPPLIDVIEEICVVAGEKISFDVTATDPDDPLQKIKLTATGGPLIIDNQAAIFEVEEDFVEHPVIGKFEWQTNCNHISDQFYTIVFRAKDDFNNMGLADLKTVKIKVVGPAPENVTLENQETEVDLFWEAPYLCEIADNNFFRGF